MPLVGLFVWRAVEVLLRVLGWEGSGSRLTPSTLPPRISSPPEAEVEAEAEVKVEARLLEKETAADLLNAGLLFYRHAARRALIGPVPADRQPARPVQKLLPDLRLGGIDLQRQRCG